MTKETKGLGRVRRRQTRKVAPRELHNQSVNPQPESWQRESTHPFDYTAEDDSGDKPGSKR